ncbi:MAG: 16S rRNA (guanine(966)-N(2))-methyltransferase RsmD [Ignavibacteria bacterium]|jgi:16S rRNA (guanine966-N2)-methyltransferase|nr:16S rRNA (guanine(966)-N(2))-methyltransferase RsmD [Ignavibacteria bacterium]
MRIISGKYKGRNFSAKLPTGIRPTQDAMRETIFNVLNNYIDIDGSVVADVCAGAGMLGLEALSRGAKYAYFVDKSGKAVEYIRNSIEMVSQALETYKILNLDALQYIGHQALVTQSGAENTPIDLLFLDPPYKTDIVNASLELLTTAGILANDGIIVAETAVHTVIELYGFFETITTRQFGAAKVSFLRKI